MRRLWWIGIGAWAVVVSPVLLCDILAGVVDMMDRSSWWLSLRRVAYVPSRWMFRKAKGVKR